MYALDEAWNTRDWDTFDAYHEQSDVVVHWPGREGTPIQGGRDHRAESIRFCAAFPDNKVKHPHTTSCSEMASSRLSPRG